MEKEEQTLLQDFSPLLYRRNPYQILGLAVDSSPREIRRRKEDIQAEIAVRQYKNGYSTLLRGDHVNEQQIADAFMTLEDPAKALVSGIFWFWPLHVGNVTGDEALLAILSDPESGMARAQVIWQSMQAVQGDSKIVATHNLAVMYHMMALESEVYRSSICLSKTGAPPVDVSPWGLLLDAELNNAWNESIDLWNLLVDDDDFWEIITRQVAKISDPRLSIRQVRQIRKALPRGFDKINAILADVYLKSGKIADCKRHVLYMKASQHGLDDVEFFVAPMVKKIQCLIESILQKAFLEAKTVYLSPKIVENVLTQTQGLCSVAQEMLGPDDPATMKLYDSVAQTCSGILVRFTNEMKQWSVFRCSMNKLLMLPASEEVKQRIRENIAIADRNEMLFIRSWRQEQANLDLDLARTLSGIPSGRSKPIGKTLLANAGVIAAIIFIIALVESCDDKSSSSRTGKRDAATSSTRYSNGSSGKKANRSNPSRPVFTEPAQPLPTNGEYENHTYKTPLAPFKITTRGDENYFVKLVDCQTGQTSVTLFVRGGHSAEVEVPLGTYIMKTASGKTWYGPEHLFGPETSCTKADSTFRFYADVDGYMGHQVTLYQVLNGNLSETRIPTSEF